MTSNLPQPQCFLLYTNFFKIKSTTSPRPTVHPQYLDCDWKHQGPAIAPVKATHMLWLWSPKGACLVLSDEFLNVDHSPSCLKLVVPYLNLSGLLLFRFRDDFPSRLPSFYLHALGCWHLTSWCRQPHSNNPAAAAAHNLLLLSTITLHVLFHLHNKHPSPPTLVSVRDYYSCHFYSLGNWGLESLNHLSQVIESLHLILSLSSWAAQKCIYHTHPEDSHYSSPIEPQRIPDQYKPLNSSIWVAYRHLSLNLAILKLISLPSPLSPSPNFFSSL